ncbi:RING-H2 finger protein ATL2 [Carya illinoinensis]|uniref:RING-type E3 ubiquitin transferase n=1 Tax=Carya illinoinensis TaxID=32201 RepID=A0A8T1RD28_CARIL|nr:RING-H2 finger protein ATL2 [Carya illinoinensis]KAG6664253.1 hypothetical protein CIPAW_02G080100 [Carya illinoinensis]
MGENDIPADYPLKRGEIDYNRSSEPAYALSGKIMLSAIVILFFVVILMVCLHLYARWYVLRSRRRRRQTQLVFYLDNANPNHAAPTVSTRGLDASVLNSLPVFLYSSKTHPEPTPDCPVCLSEFEENEKGRTLPKCGHTFHIECIDMWFHSHSTCPLCRSAVEHGQVSESPDEVVLAVGEPERIEAGSSSGLCSDCEHENEQVDQPSSSTVARRKPMELVGVSIEVPRRNVSFGDESNSPASQRGFKSPLSRMLSLKRILGRDKRASESPTSANAASCCSAPEPDIERGAVDDSRQKQV